MKILSNAVVFIAAAIAATPSVVVADVRHVSSLESTRLFPDVDFQVDVDVAVQSHSPNPCANKEGRRVGKAWVYPAFVQKLQKATGKTVDLPGSSFQVQTLYITETTNRHIDSKLTGDLKRSQLKASDADGSMTAFYVQKSTADAYFETDDDEMCIPIVEGSALYFNGGLPHHTVLNSPGAIKLVGPFLLSTLESVGCCNPTADPYDTVCCRCDDYAYFDPQECCGVVQAPPAPSPFDNCPAPKAAKSRAPKASKSPGSSSLVANQLKSDGSSLSLSPLAGIITAASSIVAVSVFLYW